jgi:hypothetical protein
MSTQSDGEEFNVDSFSRNVDNSLKAGREAFKEKYSPQLKDLKGLTREDVTGATPDMTKMEQYKALITVVEEASRVNLAQSELKIRIEQLGAAAITIAKGVPSLAKLLV